MKILVLNCGSSSVKYKLFDIDSKSVLAQGGAEKIGLEDSFLKLTLPNGEKVILKTSMPEHHSAIQNILNVLTGKEYGCIESFDEIDAVGHRVVHGGEKFNKSVLITDEVIEKIKECYDMWRHAQAVFAARDGAPSRLPAGGNHVYAPGRAFGLFAAKCQNPGLPAGPQTAGGAASASVRWARHVRGPFAGCRTVFCQKRRLPQRSAGYAVCLLYPRRAFVPVSADGQAAHRHPGPFRSKKGGCAPCMRFF